MAKSNLVSWMGVLMSIIQALVKEVYKLGGDDESIRKLATPEGEDLVKQIAKFIVGVVRPIYNLTVDRTKTLAEMIKAGKYDCVNSDITQEHFPVVGSGKEEKEFILFDFKRNISSDDAIAEMSQAGCEPGDIADLLALGSDQPELQRQFPIVALKSSWRVPGGCLLVPCLCSLADDRRVPLRSFGSAWYEDDRFLGRRK
ncbi:hypothetical protein KJ786_00610 [Patescibacteria group bacterium]|nr:hypothetical protein [Patescibacteria group bacterium]